MDWVCFHLILDTKTQDVFLNWKAVDPVIENASEVTSRRGVVTSRLSLSGWRWLARLASDSTCPGSRWGSG